MILNQANNYRKTRIAPTPSGFLHLGNVFSFALTAALAQENQAKVLLRVDDLDQARVNKQYIQDIFDTLEFLEIPWDEGPKNIKEFEDGWSQQHRLDNYNEAIGKLCENDLVFACVCSRQQIRALADCNCRQKQIPLDTANTALRLITDDKKLTIKNHKRQATEAILPKEMRNFIVRRRDGLPSYQLTSVVDDLFYGIDLVVRGKDLWASTLAQHSLASALGEHGFNDIFFYHHSLLIAEGGKKLSKSAGATSVRYLRENGKKPSDIFMLIAGMLGVNKNANTWEELAASINKC